MNSVLLIGRLTRDPEVRYTAETQLAVAKFSLAIDDGYGEKKKTNFPSIVTFGKTAESCEKFLGNTLTKKDNQISIKFEVSFNIDEGETKEVRRNDINSLYFNIVESVITEEMRRDLYDLRCFIRSVDKEGIHREKIENIVDAIYNGNEYKRG